MEWLFRGCAWVFGDDVPNDDGIMPLRMTRAQVYDPSILAKHCFEHLEPRFAEEARPGDVVIGGRNFGFGNAHIQGFLGLKGAGVGIVAESMPRSSLRSCVNAGVPILCPVPTVRGFLATGERIEVDFSSGRIVNLTKNVELEAAPLPDAMQMMVACGGGIGYMRQRLGLGDKR